MTWNPTAFREHSFKRTFWAFPSSGRVSPRGYPSMGEVSSLADLPVAAAIARSLSRRKTLNTARCFCGSGTKDEHRAQAPAPLHFVLVFSGLGS
ncbi:hypothetical protein CABS03_01379 [Colletotrichum abscissum]|uniref:Uncharacterized protein n=1 Tax=Colletotrichum abscissum TaxID=1671311 RepID=A0A9Q0AWY5_9PEZI|nr:hypothetical protein CABS02_10814 [Colletotrichum abscissum]